MKVKDFLNNKNYKLKTYIYGPDNTEVDLHFLPSHWSSGKDTNYEEAYTIEHEDFDLHEMSREELERVIKDIQDFLEFLDMDLNQ